MGDVIKTNRKGIIYHYCSTETFFSIVTNKCLRLSDITKTNDYLEKEWSLRVQEEVLENILNSIFQDRKIDFDPYKEDTILGYGNFFDIFKVSQNSLLSSTAFTSCFSKNGDLLSQWRAYASDGTGVSIGFDSKAFGKLATLCSDFYLTDIFYKKSEQVKAVTEVISDFFDELTERYLSDNSPLSFGSYIEENDDWVCPQLALRLLPINHSLKNTAFIEECEQRIIFCPK